MSPQATLDPGDLALLRAFEPVIRYTQGGLLSAAIEPYLAECDLWLGRPSATEALLPVGEVTVDALAAAEAPPGESLFLRSCSTP